MLHPLQWPKAEQWTCVVKIPFSQWRPNTSCQSVASFSVRVVCSFPLSMFARLLQVRLPLLPICSSFSSQLLSFSELNILVLSCVWGLLLAPPLVARSETQRGFLLSQSISEVSLNPVLYKSTRVGYEGHSPLTRRNLCAKSKTFRTCPSHGWNLCFWNSAILVTSCVPIYFISLERKAVETLLYGNKSHYGCLMYTIVRCYYNNICHFSFSEPQDPT